jgi:hypothetical protein
MGEQEMSPEDEPEGAVDSTRRVSLLPKNTPVVSSVLIGLLSLRSHVTWKRTVAGADRDSPTQEQ